MTEPMTEERIKEMTKAHVRRTESGLKSFCVKCGQFYPCNAVALLAEVERLRGEVERLKPMAKRYLNLREGR